MQQPIRYYITKSGEEPTVRSVRVAREDSSVAERSELVMKSEIDHSPAGHLAAGRKQRMKSLVQGAIRKRVPQS